MKTVTLHLPDAVDAKLRALAKQRGKSKTALIRESLDTLLSQTNGPGDRSCHELARDLAGSLEGPGDLTVNPSYMEEYGR